MSWSLGETRALAIKAARGAGLSWGVAEEAGFAVHWLEAHGSPGVQALVRYLHWRSMPGCDITPVWSTADQQGMSAMFCPLELGAKLQDTGEGSSGHLGWVRQPLLLAPFLTASGPYRLIWADTSILIAAHGMTTPAETQSLLIEHADCRLEKANQEVPAEPLSRRVSTAEAAHMILLEAFAARTYAPATEQSRLAGAGAGLRDND
ncbi:MAG: DUF3726 domain-containing protein [Geminicoccaceae bacterium]